MKTPDLSLELVCEAINKAAFRVATRATRAAIDLDTYLAFRYAAFYPTAAVDTALHFTIREAVDADIKHYLGKEK
jgi:hypothetical protein